MTVVAGAPTQCSVDGDEHVVVSDRCVYEKPVWFHCVDDGK